MTDRKIGNVEAISLVLTIMINHIILNLPKNLITTTSSSSIINVIFISIIALGIIYVICQLLKRFPSFDILDISKFLGGKWLKIVMGVLFIAYLVFTMSILLRSFSEGLKIIFFPKTSVPIIMLLFILVIIIANKLGFSAIVRSNLFFMPVVLLSILSIFIANLDNFTIERMFPLLGNGWIPTFFSGLSNLFAFGGISYLYLLPPHLKESNGYSKVAFASIGISAFYLLISVATLLLMFPFFTTTEEIFPLYLASRFIEFGRFFQRLDAVFLLIWILSVVSYLCIAFYFTTSIFQKITNMQYTKWYVPLFAALIFGISLLPENMQQINFLENTVYKYIIIILIFIIGLSILLFANLKYNMIQKRKGVVNIEKTMG